MTDNGILQQIRKNFFDIKNDEWPNVLLMSLFFFLVIATFWILKPLKRGLIVNFYQDQPLQLLGMSFAGAEVEQLAKVVNMIVVYGIVVGYTLLSRKLRRQHLNFFLNTFFGGLFLIFAYLMQNPGAATTWSFYVLGDMFNSAMVTFFWAFSSDIFSAEQAKRTYGMVGLGGIIGGIVGSTVVASYVSELGRPTLMFICLIPLAIMTAIGYIVNSRTEKKKTVQKERNACAEGKRCNAIFEGADIVFRSKYLMAIVAIIALYEMVSNIVDFQLSATIAQSISSDLEKDAYFGFVGQVTSIGSLVVQLFLTSFVMKRYGVGIALLFLPIAITFGSVGFLVIPSLVFVTIMSASDNSLNYSINQSAKEALYTPTDPDVKYKAKAFIDMFVQRFAKVIAVVLNLAVAAWVGLAHVRWLSIACLLILVVWILAVRYAGRQFDKKASTEDTAA